MNRCSLTNAASDFFDHQLTQYDKKNLIQKARTYVIKREEIRKRRNQSKGNKEIKNNSLINHYRNSKNNPLILPESIRHFNDLLKKEMNGNQKVVALYHVMSQLNKMSSQYLLKQNKPLVLKGNYKSITAANHLNTRSSNNLSKIEDNQGKAKHRKVLTEIDLTKILNLEVSNSISNNNKKRSLKKFGTDNNNNENAVHIYKALPAILKVPSILYNGKASKEKESRVNKMKSEKIGYHSQQQYF